MDFDLILSLGCIFVFFGIPACLSGYSDGRFPRFGAFLFLGGLGAISYSLLVNPDGYTLEAMPDVFLHVFARFFA